MKYILSILVVLTTIPALGQGIIKYRAKAISFMDEKGKWTPQSACDYLITFDETKRVTIHGDPAQNFDVVKLERSEYDEEMGMSYSYRCIDDAGKTCVLILTKKDGKAYLLSVSDGRVAISVEIDKL